LNPRVLIVDDHDAWRRRIASTLRKSRRWQVIAEGADGVEAVHKAVAQRPDLILLDIELPALNGIEAARQILALNPGARILFVSAHRSWDIVAAAFATGARGYVLKADAGHELLPAMNTVIQGKRFVSATLTGRSFDPATRTRHVLPALHEVGFYSESAGLVDQYVRFAQAALDGGKSLILATAESRRDEVCGKLQALGVQVDAARKERRFVWSNIADLFSPFMVDGWPDEERFWKTATALFTQAAAAARCQPPGVAACGDGADSLLRAGRGEAAIRLEQLWDELARTFNVDVFCPYSITGLHHDEASDVIQRIRKEHSAVLT
jgi:DNA-binding NarL/FixJ family response regulator